MDEFKMRPILLVYIIAIGIPLAYLTFIFLFFRELYLATLPEFVATSLGVIISFGIAQYATSVHEHRQAKQVLKAIKRELKINLEVLDNVKKAVSHRSSKALARTFKTNTWEALNTVLTGARDYDVVVSLGELYWKFAILNELIKQVGVEDTIFSDTGVDPEEIEEHTNDLIYEIDREIGKQKE